jgi:hypothetical protein
MWMALPTQSVVGLLLNNNYYDDEEKDEKVLAKRGRRK